LVLLPQASVAIQVRAINRAPPQLLLTTSLKVTVTAPQASWEVATPVLVGLVLAGHSRVRLVGITRLGGVMSRTVIVWIAFVLFPQ
jgi:hypothetical protein